MRKIYYNDYYGTPDLTNQKAVNEKLIELDSLHLIGEEDLNPMSIRLFVLKQSLDEINKQTKEIIDLFNIGKKASEEYGLISNHCLKKMVEPASGSDSYTLKIEVIDFNPSLPKNFTIQNDKVYTFKKETEKTYCLQDNEIHLFKLHKSVYMYFTNYMSALDRIAYEIKRLYSVDKKFTYQHLTRETDVIKYLQGKRFNEITNSTLSKRSKKVFNESKYRNRLSHDGILRLRLNEEDGHVRIQHDPMKDDSKFKVKLKDHCNKKFTSLIELLNNIYGQIYVDLKDNRIPRIINS